MAKIEFNWQRRAVIVFAGSLIVLSIFLAAFAIREAKRERLLREKDIAEGQRRIADTVAGQAKSLLSEFEQRVGGLLRFAGDKIATDKFSGIAKGIVETDDLVADIFLLDGKGDLSFPHSRPLYLLPRAVNPSREVLTGSDKSGLWKQAENAEFRERRPVDAVELYRRLLDRTPDQGFRALALSRIARCYMNSGNPAKAIEFHRRLLETASPELTSEGIPLAVTAWYQMAAIFLDSRRPLEAAEALFKLREGLLGGEWPLTKSRFEFYEKRAKELFADLAGELSATDTGKALQKSWDSLQGLESGQRRRMTALEALDARLVSQIESKSAGPYRDLSGFSHVSGSKDDGSLLVSFKRLDDNVLLGLIIDPESLARRLMKVYAGKVDTRDRRPVQIKDESGRIVAGDDFASWESSPPKPVFSRTFDDGFPPWTMDIFPSDLDAGNRQFLMRGGLYILSAAVVIAALFLGGIMAIRSTAKELRLAKLKADFVSTVSHEFRTPLTSIRYLAELLQRGRVRDEDRKRQYYETITGESERLSRLIENLLDFSKIEAGLKEYQFAAVDVTALAEDVASRFERQAGPRKFVLETKIEADLPRIPGDRDALSRALFNLLDNALKYSGDGPRLHLRAWSDPKAVFLEVEDHGIGISRADQRRVFEKFFRADQAMQGTVKGSGIGLTLVDHIVKAHGGNVRLESQVGQGTKVTIELPRRPPAGNGRT